MSKLLPVRPSLRNLQHQAKRLLKSHRERKPATEAEIAALEERLGAALAGLERDWR